MNSELPKVDITYGTKRYGERNYKSAMFFISISAKKQNCTFEITKMSGEKVITNPIKTNTRVGLAVFSDSRLMMAEIASIKTLIKQDIEFIESKANIIDKSLLPSPKTFHLILNKSHAQNKRVAVFMKNGEILKGISKSCDFDSVTLDSGEYFVIAMYDAVKRIVPLEPDGSIAE